MTTEYEVKNSESWRTLGELIDAEFTALKDNLYGIIGDSETGAKSTSNNKNI